MRRILGSGDLMRRVPRRDRPMLASRLEVPELAVAARMRPECFWHAHLVAILRLVCGAC